MERTNQKITSYKLEIMELISIIIPVYNHAHMLKRSVESIFRQTYRPLEVIIVNDGSTDNFDQEIEECLLLTDGDNIGGGSVLSVIRQSNLGAAAARNRGFTKAKGEYVIFWDADTLAHPQMLQKMFDALQKYPEADYAYSQFKFDWKKMRSSDFKIEKLKKFNYIDTTSLIRRSALSPSYLDGAGGVAGPFDPSLKRFQDWDLWLSMLEQDKTGIFIPEVLYKKTIGDRKGMSSWLPSFFYKLQWKTKQIKEYEEAKAVVLRKHKLI